MYLNINKTKIDIIVANTFYLKLKGLMGKKNISYGMLFPKTNSIHTFFMKDNIDVLALDENNIVFAKVVNMNKNNTFIAKHPIKKTSILELPKNASHDIKVGDKLTFICK